ncbi:MAG: HTH-type transcriptional activator IlvY, partial [Pseudomonadota bacterium]
MDARTLRSFLTLADTLNFSRAAAACHMSPSTLSRAIAQLEARVGAPLFERTNRHVNLTGEGELFRMYARESLALWESFRDSLTEDARTLTGELTMYCSVTASHSFLFRLLNEFRQRHPNIRIRLETGDAEQALLKVQSGDAQLAIGSRPQSLPTTVTFEPITQTALTFIAPRDDAAALRRHRAWARAPMILPEAGLTRDRVDRWFRQQDIAPNVWAQVNGYEAIVSMVSLGNGVGVVPELVLANSPLRDRVTALNVRPALDPLDVGLMLLKRSTSNRL